MKERPILYSTPMVEAILSDRKTKTRRVVKGLEESKDFGYTFREINNGFAIFDGILPTGINCPYGKVGDRLWVREKTRIISWTEEGEVMFEYADGTKSEWVNLYSEEQDPDGDKYMEWWERYSLRLEKLGATQDEEGNMIRDGFEFPWKPSIHMPRAASRILLEITDLRCERLQDISESDAIAEGVEWCGGDDNLSQGNTNGIDAGWVNYMETEKFDSLFVSPISSFQSLWESINGHESWKQNPWVWVIEFKSIEN